MKGEPGRYEKEFNCLDVWFDSGSTHLAVLNEANGLSWPADLYLEGSDQHRGWFQSSLWVSMGVKGCAPYRQVLTHGFVLDEKGQPMSKSLGNVISPLDVIKDKGADVIRMWVSSEDYRGDVSISKNALEQITQAYRRIRNTLRFILGNVYDFNPQSDAVGVEAMSPDDRWLLLRLNELVKDVTRAYEKYEFHRVYQMVNGFCVTELGALYIDMTKDRLYCSAPDDRARRASQTVFHEIASVLARLIAPIVVFTSDEVWDHLRGEKAESIHLADFPKPNPRWQDAVLSAKWERLLALRGEVTKLIEPLRAQKLIGSSLDARVVFRSDDAATLSFLRSNEALLPALLIASGVSVRKTGVYTPVEELRKAPELTLGIEVARSEKEKCPRCWRRVVVRPVGQEQSEPCDRCADVMRRAVLT
jgi:isoleucyl-tRNA synthetase